MRFPYLLASMLTISSFSSAMHDVAPYLEFVRPSAAADGRRFARAILSSKLVTFSVEWKALFDGAMVGEIDLYTPVVNFVQGPSRDIRQVGVNKPCCMFIKELFPLNINRFAVQDGTVHYRDFHSRPKVDLKLDQIQMLGTNLTNNEKLGRYSEKRIHPRVH
jgi:Domain of Unknown Function (DUF748)